MERDEQLAHKIYELAYAGKTDARIARLLEMSQLTVERHYSRETREARDTLNSEIQEEAYAIARMTAQTEGELRVKADMIKFICARKLGWKEEKQDDRSSQYRPALRIEIGDGKSSNAASASEAERSPDDVCN